MLDRRAFTFGSLVALISRGASASSGVEPEEQRAATGIAGRWLVPSYVTRRKGGELHIELSLHNSGEEPIDLLVRSGSRPGPTLDVYLEDGLGLPEIVDPDRRDLVSRIGSSGQYAPLGAGQSLKLGPWRFEWAADLTDVPVDIVAKVYLGSDVTVELPARHVLMGSQEPVNDL